MNFFSGLGKYWQLIVLVLIFIVLESLILGINFYDSFQITRDAHAIQLSSRQAVLSQHMLTSLQGVRESLEENTDYELPLTELSTSFQQFDEALDAFIYGGTMIGEGQGNDALLEDSVYREQNEQLLSDIERYWSEYRRYLQSVVYASYDELVTERELTQRADAAYQHGKQINATFLSLIEDFASEVEGISQQNSAQTRNVQTVGIAAAVVFFILLFSVILRRLLQSDQAAVEARRQTDEIMQTVEEGLFLVDNQLLIGQQHSDSLNRILRTDNIANQNFIEFISPKVSNNTTEITQSYIDLLFSPHVKEELVTELNPLGQVKIIFEDGNSGFDIRHLNFSFKRVVEDGEIKHLLVSVRDITETVELEAELKESARRANREMELLVTLLQIDPNLASMFIRSSQQSLTQFNSKLEAPARNAEALREKSQSLFRLAHKLKGECSAVGLDVLAKAVHELEDELDRITQKPSISGNDFLPVAVKLRDLMKQVDQLEELMSRMDRLHRAIASNDKPSQTAPSQPVAEPKPSEPLSAEDRWRLELDQVASRVASDMGKQVAINITNFEPETVAESHLGALRDIAIQLVRNATAHGIESPSERQQANKPTVGMIRLELSSKDGHCNLRVIDDGRGLDLEAIREQAIKRGLMTEAQAAEANKKQLTKLIFQPQFSTRDLADENAGRGVGLDVVRDIVRNNMGGISVKTELGRYTEFRIRMPNAEQTIQFNLSKSA